MSEDKTGGDVLDITKASKGRASQANKLVALSGPLLRCEKGYGYALIGTGDTARTVKVGSGDYRKWLQYEFNEKFGEPPSAAALKQALEIIEMSAQRRGKRYTSPPEVDTSGASDDDTKTDQLLRLARSKCELFHTPDKGKYSAYADVMIGQRRETLVVKSREFGLWLRECHLDTMGNVPGTEVVNSVIDMLDTLATRKGPEREVFVRVGGSGGDIYIDLGDETWRAVQVSKTGWRVVDQPPVRFRRGNAMTPLPVPAPGGKIADLQKFVNTKDSDSFTMVVAWLLAALRDRGPYPILIINGEQGCAKSTMTTLLRSLIDPSTANLRAPSVGDRDLFITATHSWVLAFDNCQKVAWWLSDALCRIATSGGYATRQLFSDMDEVVFSAKRPICMNGISEFVERGDLADRSVFVHLQEITEQDRKTEKELFAEFEKGKPRLFGALLDGLAEGLCKVDDVNLKSKPRMAEFAEWAVACSGSYIKDGSAPFMNVYGRNRAVAVQQIVESDPVATAIERLAYKLHKDGFKNNDDECVWSGNASELLYKLTGLEPDSVTKAPSWPKTPSAMGVAVARVAPVLRAAGIPVDRPNRTQRKRLIQIAGVEEPQDNDEEAPAPEWDFGKDPERWLD